MLTLALFRTSAQEVLDLSPSLEQWLARMIGAVEQSAQGRQHDLFLQKWQRQGEAVRQLSSIGTNAWPAVPALLGLSAHPDFHVGVAAGTVLARIKADEHPRWHLLQKTLEGNTNASRAFLYLVTGKDEYSRPYQAPERRFALAALGAVGPAATPAAPALVGLLQSNLESDRKLWVPLVVALKQIGADPQEFVPLLKHTLPDENAPVDLRVSAAEGLAIVGSDDAETLQLLRQQLLDAHSHVKVAAAHALWQLKVPAGEILPTLAPLLKHKLVSIRLATLRTLSEMGQAAWVCEPEIRALVADPNESVSQSASATLKRITTAP
jgi:HEAT repeat protein